MDDEEQEQVEREKTAEGDGIEKIGIEVPADGTEVELVGDPNPSERLAEIEARVNQIVGGKMTLPSEDVRWLLEQVREARTPRVRDEAFLQIKRDLEQENARLREAGRNVLAWSHGQGDLSALRRGLDVLTALADSGEASGEAG